MLFILILLHHDRRTPWLTRRLSAVIMAPPPLSSPDVMTCGTGTSISSTPDYFPLYPILSRFGPRDSDSVLFGGGSTRSYEHEFLKCIEIQLQFSDGNFSLYSPSLYGTAVC